MFPNAENLLKEVPMIGKRRELWNKSAHEITFKDTNENSFDLSKWNKWQNSDQNRSLVSKSKKSQTFIDILNKNYPVPSPVEKNLNSHESRAGKSENDEKNERLESNRKQLEEKHRLLLQEYQELESVELPSEPSILKEFLKRKDSCEREIKYNEWLMNGSLRSKSRIPKKSHDNFVGKVSNPELKENPKKKSCSKCNMRIAYEDLEAHFFACRQSELKNNARTLTTKTHSKSSQSNGK